MGWNYVIFKVPSIKTILRFYDTSLSNKQTNKTQENPIFQQSQIMARNETLTAQVLVVLSILELLLCLLQSLLFVSFIKYVWK